jgi:D-alanine-D-alanine ligase
VLREPPELVFNIAEGFGTRSREAHVPAVLEMLRVPCTHSDPLTCAVTLDKAVAKTLVAAEGVPTPRWAVAASADDPALARLALPVIAKPLAEGSSIGIRKSSRIERLPELREAVARLGTAYGQPVLVEEFCPGPEFTVGILGNGRSARVVAAMEIVPRTTSREQFVYSLEVKRNYETEVEYHVPPRQPVALVRRAHEVALGAYRALGCRDVARVDLRVGADGEPRFLEVNPLPGLNPVTGDLVILAGRAGLSYEGLIGAIVDAARERHKI